MKTGAFQSGNAANSNPENTKPSADLSAGRALLIHVEGKPILSGFWLVACFGSRKAMLSSALAPAAERLRRYLSTEKINTRTNIPVAKGTCRWSTKAICFQNPHLSWPLAYQLARKL